MNSSILAHNLHQIFTDYPVRPHPYPDPLPIDLKTKKPIDQATKKPIDAANLLPKKKKANKKTPAFVIPDLATELK
jgi:hypothetical protein